MFPDSPASEPTRGFRQDLPWLLLLLAAVLWNLVRLFGHSPGVWVDTLIENLFVEDCLLHGKCTMVGAGATVGIFHSAGYFSWRSMLEWLGWQAEGTYHVFLFINALGVVLVALAARRMATRTAGAVAAVLMTVSIGVPTQLDVISDVVPMPFLGAVFALAALTATTTPSLGMTAMLALVAAVASNFYATGLLLGVSGVFIALLQPRRRWQHFLVSGFTFAAATFALSPGTWLIDAKILLTRHVGNANALAEHPVAEIQLVRITAAAVGLWLAAWVLRSSVRRELHVMAAIILPLFIPMVVGSRMGRLDPQPKYVAHVMAAVSVAIAVPLTEGPRWVWLKLAALRPSLAQSVGRAFDFALPYLACALIALGAVTKDDLVAHRTILPYAFADLAAAKQVLAERGWTWAKAARNLRAPDEIVRRAVIRWVPDWPKSGKDDQTERAYLLKLPASLVARPMPPGVVEVRQSAESSTLVGLTCSWIDWSAFRVCNRDSPTGIETCVDSGWPADPEGHSDNDKGMPGMPLIDAHSQATRFMTIHLRLQPRADCPEQWIYMPKQTGVCPGRIVSVDGSNAGIEPGGRWLKLKQPTEARDVAIEWELGGNVCSVEYRGYPPFFVEGDPASTTYLSTVLERQEGPR